MTKKYKSGAFRLKDGVTDLEAFEKSIEAQIREIIAWGEKNDVGLTFGTTEDGTYICQYRTVAQTAQLCRWYVSELRKQLKKIFPKLSLIYETSGECFG